MIRTKNGMKSEKSKTNINLTFILSVLLFIFSVSVIFGFNFGIAEYRKTEEKQKQECIHKDWKVINKDGELVVKCKKCGIKYKEVYNDNNN